MRSTCLAIAVACVFGCTGRSSSTPRLSAVSPTEGPNDTDVTVNLLGEDFEARVYTDFGAPDASHWERAFTAALVPLDTGLPEVPLEQVAFDGAGRLSGVVRAGAARGFYGVRVADPLGLTGFLPDAYRVVASASHVTSFRFDPIAPQRPGVPFGVALTALDAAGDRVDGYTDEVSLADLTGTVAPTRVGPFVLGRARAQVTVGGLAAADRLDARDASGRSGASSPFAVRPGLVVALAFISAAQTLNARQCSGAVELECRDSYGFASPVEADLGAQLSAAPPDGVLFFADAACTQQISTLELKSGSTRFTFYFRADVGPGFALRVVPEVLPSSTQREEVTP